jgi:polysaccharide deacetylase family protein (PEP-CTERM system associated)
MVAPFDPGDSEIRRRFINMDAVREHCVMSIDVEDWFHILDLPSTPSLVEWDRLPSHVERNFLRLLDLAAENNVRCTCFFLGWVAHRHPKLVTAALERGHEIASHGWAHRLAYQLTPKEFYEDAAKAKDVIEQISGCRVLGYRSAGFSLSDRNLWVFDELLHAGYVYDSSVFPSNRAHGGWRNGNYAPYLVNRLAGNLIEFPMSVEEVLGHPYCFFGGGYLRLFPLAVIRRMAASVLRRGRPAMFYVHPREIDPDQPRLAMNPWRRFKSYVNLSTTETKLRELLGEFDFVTLKDLAEETFPASIPKPIFNQRVATAYSHLNL